VDIYLLAMISLFGAMSPGPDFAIVTRFALSGSRRAALMATLGVATAVCIHVTYCILGVGLFLKSSPILFRILQIIGSIYLGYLGVQLLISKKTGTVAASGSLRKAFVSGFFTNLLNPKATLFILSLLTQFVTEKTPFLKQKKNSKDY